MSCKPSLPFLPPPSSVQRSLQPKPMRGPEAVEAVRAGGAAAASPYYYNNYYSNQCGYHPYPPCY